MTIQSIPASQLVNSLPSVLSPGGSAPALNMVMLTADGSIPIGTVQAFPDAISVADWFGPNSQEAIDAAAYFSGFIGADQLPTVLYFFQYNASAVGAYLRGGSQANVPLATIQALTGTITVTIDGRQVISAAIDLSSATSFTNAAALIQTALQTPAGIFSGTGTVTNASPILTINSTVSGELHVGDVVVGTDIPANTTILSFGSYTVLVGTGTVNLSANATGAAGPEAVTVASAATVAYDNLRDAFVIESPTTGVNSTIGFAAGAPVAGLKLSSATGAVTSQGAAGTSPAAAMNEIVGLQQNWATFMTVFDPDAGSLPPTNKLAFANWVSTATPAGTERFAYAAWDADQGPTVSNSDASCFAQLVIAAGYNGVVPIYDSASGVKAAFFGGMAASIDFDEPAGRITFAYKGQAGLVPDVTTSTAAQNLIANGYNFYGQYATATQQFQLFQKGTMPGEWVWADPYINQIWLNQTIIASVMQLLTQTKAIPYNNAGYNLVRSAIIGPVQQALVNGVIVAGVALTPAQAQEINTAAGNSGAATAVQNLGYYLQIGVAPATTRQARTSPPIKLWYTDGGSIQQVTIDSIDVE